MIPGRLFDEDGNEYDEIIWEDQSDYWAVDDGELEFWLNLSEDTPIRFCVEKENES